MDFRYSRYQWSYWLYHCCIRASDWGDLRRVAAAIWRWRRGSLIKTLLCWQRPGCWSHWLHRAPSLPITDAAILNFNDAITYRLMLSDVKYVCSAGVLLSRAVLERGKERKCITVEIQTFFVLVSAYFCPICSNVIMRSGTSVLVSGVVL